MVSIVTRLRAWRSGVRFLTEEIYVSPLEMFTPAVGTTQRLTEWVEGLLPGREKQPGRENVNS